MHAGAMTRNSLALLSIGLLASACGSSPVATSSTAAQTPACDRSGSVATATTASYGFVVDVGPQETMYSEDDVSAHHPTSGEVMLGGEMTDVHGADVGHLEVHICSRNSGAVIQSANPTITLTDTTAGTAAESVPVAEMQGVSSGINDIHYGNNVLVPRGHAFTLVVALNGETATMHFTAP